MLSTKEFIRQSLELNLFFIRIMKEHAFFLEAGFTPKNTNLAERGDDFRVIFTQLLKKTVALSDGVISPAVKKSGEIVTEFTVAAEKATTFLTTIPLNPEISKAEANLTPGCKRDIPRKLEPLVKDLNNKVLAVVRKFIDYKTKVLDAQLDCSIFTFNYPLLIEHIRREAIFFHSLLSRIQKREKIDIAREAVEQQRFWNRIMAEHVKFIRGLLDPTEEALIKTSNNFGKEFDKLTAKAIKLNDSIANLTEKDLEATKDIRNFKKAGTIGLLNCDIRSIIIPLLGDHVLREANHYLRLLRIFDKAL